MNLYPFFKFESPALDALGLVCFYNITIYMRYKLKGFFLIIIILECVLMGPDLTGLLFLSHDLNSKITQTIFIYTTMIRN